MIGNMEFYVIGYTAIFFFLASFFTIIAKWIVKWVVDWKIFNGVTNFIKALDNHPCYEDVFAFNGRVFSIVCISGQFGREHSTKRITKKVFNKAFDALISKAYVDGNLRDLRFCTLRKRMVNLLRSLSEDMPMIRNNLFTETPYNLQTVKLHSTNHVDYYLVTL